MSLDKHTPESNQLIIDIILCHIIILSIYIATYDLAHVAILNEIFKKGTNVRYFLHTFLKGNY